MPVQVYGPTRGLRVCPFHLSTNRCVPLCPLPADQAQPRLLLHHIEMKWCRDRACNNGGTVAVIVLIRLSYNCRAHSSRVTISGLLF